MPFPDPPLLHARRLPATLSKRWALPLIGIALVAGLWGLWFHLLSAERERIDQEALVRTQGLARAYVEYADRALDQIDQLTRFVAYNYVRYGSDIDLTDMVRAQLSDLPGLSALSIIGDDGHVIASTATSLVGNVSEREYFKKHEAGQVKGLDISPVMIGLISKRPVMVMSRRMSATDGSFLGVVAVSADPTYFSNFYDKASFGTRGMTALIGLDGQIRARRIGDRLGFGVVATADFDLKRFAGQPEGALVVDSMQVDGQARYVAYKKLQDHPMVVIAALDRQEVLAPFEKRKTELQALFGGATAVLCLVFGGMGFFAERLRRSQREVDEAGQRFEAASNASLDAFFILRAVRPAGPEGTIEDFEVIHCNDRGAELMGLPASKIIGQLRSTVVVDPADIRTRGLYIQVTNTREPVEAEFVRDRGAMKCRCVHYQVVPLDDGVAVTIRDVTAERAQEAEVLASREVLREREAMVRTITDNVPALISRIDRDLRYTFVNAHVVALHGRSDLLGASMPEVRGEADYASVAGYVEQAMAGETVSYMKRGATDQGRHERIYQAHLIPDKAEDGSIRGVYSMTVDITELAETQARLAAQERRLRDITDNVPAMICYVDQGYRYRFANAQYQLMLGVLHDAMDGLHIREVLGEATFAQLQPYMDRALKGERVQWARYGPEPRADSYYLIEYVPDIDVDGNVLGCYSMVLDITDRHRAEQRLAASEARLRGIAENLPAVIGQFDREQNCLFANRHVIAMSGQPGATAAELTFRTALGPELYQQHLPHLPTVLAGEKVTIEATATTADRTYSYQVHLVPDGQGGFYAMAINISLRREAEIKLARSEQRLRGITDNIPALISHIDREERIDFANDTFRTWLGLDPAAMLGRTMLEVFGEEVRAPRLTFIRQALAGNSVQFESELRGLGQVRTTQTKYVPDFGPEGAVEGIFALAVDITDFKSVQLQLTALARVDALTNLPNRLAFDEAIELALGRSRRAGRALALLFLDVDRFKAINDTMGHAGGDAVLTEFARRLRSAVRATDFVARLAGDEFVVVLEQVGSMEAARAVAAKIVESIGGSTFPVAGSTLEVTTSIGLAFHAADTDESAAALLARADAALYGAKASGRDTFQVAV